MITLKQQQQGSSIVEVMVGLFVGMMVMITAYESFAFLEAMKRTTVSDNSAFSTLITGMQQVDHDIKMAGLGLSIRDFNTCTAMNAFYNGSTVADGGIVAPVVITNGGGQPDSITVFYANSITAGAPTNVLTTMASSTAPLNVNTSVDLQAGQLAMLMEPSETTPCTLIGVTDVQDVGNAAQVSHVSGASLYNPPNPDTAYSNSILYTESAVILNLGTPRWQTWRINNETLETLDLFTQQSTQMASDIVHIRAQYGVTDGASNSISEWVEATGEWANLDRAHILRIRAIRLALVARNPKREKPTVSGGPCDATTTAPSPWPGAAALDLSNDPNWQCYRYEVMKTIMPLKNMVWSASV